MHKSQVLFFILTSFVTGVFIGSFWFISLTGILSIVLVGTMILVVSGYHGTFGQDGKGINKRKKGVLLGFLIIVFSIGIIRFNQANSDYSILKQFSDNVIAGKGVDYTFQGYVLSDPESRGNQTKFIFRVKKIIAPKKEIITDENILITSNLSDVQLGDQLIVTGSLMSPKNFNSDFDYISYLKKDSVRVLMNYPKTIIRDGESGSSIYKYIFAVKNKFESAINKSISEPNASFINGILLGTRQNISEELKSSFNKTGTSHIMAISGYNITIVAWSIMAGLFMFFKRKKAFWITVLIIIIFTIMTGASASVVRASVMGLVLLFANGYGRLYDSKNALMLAGAAMIYQNPLVLRFDIGFQLSFMAVLGLIYLMPSLSRWARRFPEGRVKETITATLAAQIFVAPLLVYYFRSFSFVSVLANVLILPFMPMAMLLGFITGIGGMIFLPLGQLMGHLAWALTEYQIFIIEKLALLPFSSI